MKIFKNILYLNEASVRQDASLKSAVSMALNNQAELTVIDVINTNLTDLGSFPGGVSTSELEASMVANRRQELESLVTSYLPHLDIHIDVLVGIKFIEAIRSILLNGYDLLVKAAENPSYIDRLFGSEDMHLLRKCPCPLWLMKADETADHNCIVAAVGFNAENPDSEESRLNQEIIEIASSLALSDSAALHFTHAWDDYLAGFASLWVDNPEITETSMVLATETKHYRLMNQLVENLREDIGNETFEFISPRMHLPRGASKKVIPELVKQLNADLVVMGTVARTGIPGFIIGNTAESILDQLQCSVLAIKPSGFVSPVTLGHET